MANGKKEIQNMLKAEIVLLAGRLLKAADTVEFEKLAADFRNLYHKLAAWEYLNESEILPDEPVDWNRLFGKQQVEKPEQSAEKTTETQSVSRSDTLPENNQPEETILSKHEDLYRRSVRSHFKEKQEKDESTRSGPQSGGTGSAPVRNGTKLNIGLADKIALLNNLFDKQQQVFERFLDEIGRAPTYDGALEIVARYREQLDWNGKDEYEFRLLQLIQAKFA